MTPDSSYLIAIYGSQQNHCDDLAAFMHKHVPGVRCLVFKDLATIGTLLGNESKVLLYFISTFPTAEERSFLKRLNSKHSHRIYTILCSPEKFAHDAWLLECFYFLDFPVLGRELLRSVQYFKRKVLGNPNEGLRISYKGGIHIIKYSDIQYCKGSGNYTQIFLVSGKSVFATIQLQKLRTNLENAQQFERIGKSYIFNIFNIKSLDNCHVSFLGVKNETLELSELYTKRLRGILLGVPD